MTALFFSLPAEAQAIQPAGPTLPAERSAVCQPTFPAFVGDTAQRSITDDELEAHIRDLGRLVEQAYAIGDPQGARIWQARMYAAIKQRSPTKQAQMTAEIERRISEGVDYFSVEGARQRRLSHKD